MKKLLKRNIFLFFLCMILCFTGCNSEQEKYKLTEEQYEKIVMKISHTIINYYKEYVLIRY